jgi:hypothetical protein
MLKNVGGTEKGIRLVFGGLLVVTALVLDLPTWGTATLSVVGIVALLTGTMGYCPAWSIFGINTCRVKSTT